MRLTACFVALLFTTIARAQNVGVGTTTPDASAQLDVTATNKGVLIPRMKLAERNLIADPAHGLLIYQTNQDSGFYFNLGSPASPNWTSLLSKAAAWSTKGNAGTDNSINYIGTTDFVPLQFKLNNQRAGSFDPRGNYAIGINAGNPTQTGIFNIAIGDNALSVNQFNSCIALGRDALRYNTFGQQNIAVGTAALTNNIDGVNNIAIGVSSLASTTAGSFNVAVGSFSLNENKNGQQQTAVGLAALNKSDSGFYNVGLGSFALQNATGIITNENTAIGTTSLQGLVKGSGNSALGYASAVKNGTDQSPTLNATAIGYRALANCNNCLVLGSVAGVNNALNSVNVGIGTTTPTEKLSVEGNANVNGSIRTKYSGSNLVNLAAAGTQTVNLTIPAVPAGWDHTNTVILVSNTDGPGGTINQAKLTSLTNIQLNYTAQGSGAARLNWVMMTL